LDTGHQIRVGAAGFHDVGFSTQVVSDERLSGSYCFIRVVVGQGADQEFGSVNFVDVAARSSSTFGYAVDRLADVVRCNYIVEDDAIAQFSGEFEGFWTSSAKVDRDVSRSPISVGHVESHAVEAYELSLVADFLHSEQRPDGLNVFPKGLKGTPPIFAYSRSDGFPPGAQT